MKIKNHHLISFIDVIVKKPYLKDFDQMYSSLTKEYPQYDLRDPDMMSHCEKTAVMKFSKKDKSAKIQTLKVRVHDEKSGPEGRITSRIPCDAHLRTWGGAIPYYQSTIFDTEEHRTVENQTKKKKIVTGITGPPRTVNEPPESIETIREVEFEFITQDEIDQEKCEDPYDKNLELYRENHSLKRFFSQTNLIGKDTVQNCMKKFFDPRVGIPFVPADIGKYFPLELLKKEKNPHSISKEAPSNSQLLLDNDQKVLFLDTSSQDVLFTKNRAPYTRKEVATIRAFRKHWGNLKIEQQNENEEKLRIRDRKIKDSFHSQTVFETYLKLLDEETKLLRTGLLGNSTFKNVSLWDRAINLAPKDFAGIRIRRCLWWRFCHYSRSVTNLKDPNERIVVKKLRMFLMKRHEVLESLFWDLLKELPKSAFESLYSIKLIEFLRTLLDVNQTDVKKYFDQNGGSSMVYSQAIQMNLISENLNLIQFIVAENVDLPDVD